MIKVIRGLQIYSVKSKKINQAKAALEINTSHHRAQRTMNAWNEAFVM